MSLKKIALPALLAGLMTTAAAQAQDFPTRPMTMIIPFAAGGPTDVLGRVVAQRMGEILGQQVVVENVGGAGGQTGSKRVADAQPDVYTCVRGTRDLHAHPQPLSNNPGTIAGHAKSPAGYARTTWRTHRNHLPARAEPPLRHAATTCQ